MSKKTGFHSMVFCLLAMVAHGQGGSYAVSKIPAALLEKTSAVKRYELIRFEIKNPGSAVYYYKRAITILDEAGDQFADWSEFYDKFTSIKSVEANLYDGNGTNIKSLNKSDIGDRSATDDNSLADDNRFKYHNFYCKVYPYTVEYEVEIKMNSLLFMPSWMPLEGQKFAVEHSLFQVLCPENYTIRYKSYQYNKEPIISGTKTKSYQWEVQNITAVTDEYAAPEWQRITPTVVIGPTDFEVDGYKGNMKDWKEFGKFVYSLKENKDKLPPATIAAIHALVDNLTDERKKIEILYHYMQQNTRYISIQLGIGGWQPFDASSVAQKKYGDCKALTNYMYALLKEAGIKSVYTLVKAGTYKRYMHEEFPAQQFNHVILSVPYPKDTVWLECTNQTVPPGYLGDFTCNRYALMIQEDGGHLIRTPSYTLKDNVENKKITAILDEEGNLKGESHTTYSGLQQDDLFGLINTRTKKEQMEYLKKAIDLPNYDISSFDFTAVPSSIPSVIENIHFIANNYAQVSGKRLFIQPNVLSKNYLKLKEGERVNDIDLMFEYRIMDTVEIAIPAGFAIENMPEPVSFTNQFVSYATSCKFDKNKITYTRFLERRSGRFPKADYPVLFKTYNDMFKSDRMKIVFVKKEA